MASWTVASWLLHRALFHSPGEFLLLSKEQRSAEEILQRIKRLTARLPEWMGVRCMTTKRDIKFSQIGSRIFTLPAVPEAVRLYSPTVVVWDEMAFTRDAARIWEALSPALDETARFVGISTPNGKFCMFGRLIDEASQNGFSVHRIHYRERPDRGESWRSEKQRELSEAEWRREFELSLEELGGMRVIESFSSADHVLKSSVTIPEVAGAVKRYRTIDYGYRTPAVLWIAERQDGTHVIFDEWIGDNATREDLLAAIRATDAKWKLSEKDFTWTSCDPAGLQRNDAGIPVIDFLAGAGVKLKFRRSRVEDGLDLLRMQFLSADGKIRLYVSPSCERLIVDLESYTYDERTGKPEKGVHDHAVDALRYFVVVRNAPSAPLKPKSKVAGGKR